MAFEHQTNSIINVVTLIGDSDPKKGIAVDSSRFLYLNIESNLFSIAPICLLTYQFTYNDNKPKLYDELYINVYKTLDSDPKGALILSTSLTILSDNLTSLASNEGIIERHDYVCVASSIYTLTNKMNVGYSNLDSTDVLNEIFALKDNASYQLRVDEEYSSNDKMNWVFSQKTTLEIIKKILRHTQVSGNTADIPILYSNPDKTAYLTSLLTLCLKDSKCTLIDSNTYDSLDDSNKKEYLKFTDNTLGIYQGAIPLLTNGFGQTLYQYNPWADQDFGPGILGMTLRALQFAVDIITEEIKPLDQAFRHPDKITDECLYRAYESYNFSLGSMMAGTPIKPPNLNSNMSTLKYVGTHTTDLHYTYNVLPDIYENIVRNFFSNGIEVLCHLYGQNERFANFSNFPKLGDCVNLSLNSQEEIEDIRNGKYLIGKYTLELTGLYDIPVIKYTLYRDTMNFERPRTEGEEE